MVRAPEIGSFQTFILKYSLVGQAAVLFIYFVLLQYTGIGGRLASHVFFSGPRAFQFWTFQVAIGLALPFVLMLYRKMRENVLVSCIAAIATLIGTLFGCVNIFIGGRLGENGTWARCRSEPERVSLIGPPERPLVVQVEIIPRKEYPFIVQGIEAKDGKFIKYELVKTCDRGRDRCVIRVENTKADKGRYLDVIYVKTDSRLRPLIPIYVTGMIR